MLGSTLAFVKVQFVLYLEVLSPVKKFIRDAQMTATRLNAKQRFKFDIIFRERVTQASLNTSPDFLDTHNDSKIARLLQVFLRQTNRTADVN